MFVDINLEIIALKNHVPMFLLRLVMQTAKHIYQVVIKQSSQKYVLHIYQQHVNLMQLQEQMQPKHPLAKSFKMLKERFVDIKLDPIVLQNHARTFSRKLMMQPAKHIYLLVIYQQPQHALQLKQEDANHMQLQEPMPQPKQPFAIHN